MTEQLVFDNAVEGLFIHGLKDRITPELRQQLLKLGLDLQRLQPAYEREKWGTILALTARTLFPKKSLEEAAREMGVAVTRGYDATLVGKALLALSKVIGPRRMLGRLSRSLKTSNTYVSTELIDKGPGDCEMRCKGLDLSPHFMGGIVEEAMKMCAAKDPVVQVLSSTGDEAVFRVTWVE